MHGPRRWAAAAVLAILTSGCGASSGAAATGSTAVGATSIAAGPTQQESPGPATTAPLPSSTTATTTASTPTPPPTTRPLSDPPTSDSPGSSADESPWPDPIGTPGPVVASSPATALPAVSLPGASDPACRSPRPPVVLLHGTFQRAVDAFALLAPRVAASGRCLYAVDYGNGGIGSVADSARAFAQLVAMVTRVTGTTSVDVVAYSQGGLVLRTALRDDGLADRVGVAVLLAPSFHGTTSLAGQVPAALCAACRDQAAGSALLQQLDAGGDLDGAVRYAVVSTAVDAVVTPVSGQVPHGPADRVRSLLVQDRCPASRVDHIGLPADAGVIAWTVAALDTRGRPDPTALTCGPG